MVTKRSTVKRKAVKQTAKAEVENLREYEVVYVIRPDIAEDAVGSVIDKITQLITSKGGVISGTERWGKRKLAYPIKHYIEGYYVISRFKARPAASREIEANLQITEELIRFIVVKIE